MRPQIARGALIIAMVWIGCAAKPASRSPERKPEAAALPAAPPAADAGMPQIAEACRACNGDFGVHGLDPTPRCLCRMLDAGKLCRAKDDCEGECIGDGGERKVTDPGPPPRGFFLGRCSEFRTAFGCHHFLGRRRDQPGPVRLDEPPAELCVD
jgi:hypothetical protein